MTILIPEALLWFGFVILLILFIAWGTILSYHWNHYGINEGSKKVARVSYFFISIVILSAIVFFINLYVV